MATSTRLAIAQQVAREIGGYQGSITSGTATTAVLDTLVGNKNDDELNDDLLIMPDAANATDMERIITDWTKTSGTATWEGNRTDTTFTSETFFTIPKGTWTLDQMRRAINDCLGNTDRTYRYIVPSREDTYQIPLADLTWLRNAKDVDGVYWVSSPGLLHNADFSYWHSGTTSAPDGWTLTGSGGTIARSTTFASFGSYVAQVTRSGTDVTLTYDIPYPLAKQLIDAGATIAIKGRAQSATASIGRIGINDGSSTTWSSYHSGDGEPEDLTASVTLTAAASRIRITCSVDTSDGTVSFDFIAACEGSVTDDFFNSGGTGYLMQPGRAQLWNVGSSVPVLASDILRPRGGQWVVVTRRPFATLSSDSASTEADIDMVAAGAIVQLCLHAPSSMDRSRRDDLMRQFAPIYSAAVSGLIDKPPQEPQAPRFVVRGY